MRPDMQAFNRALIDEFRAHGGKLSGQLANSTLLLLTTTGAKSGTERVTPLGFVKEDERFIVIAAKAGAPTHPDWYYNLLAHSEVTVEVGSERFPARASIAAEKDRARLIALVPYFEAQQVKTTRIIPIVVIERLAV